MTYGARARIDLRALSQNVVRLRASAGDAKMVAVVKANAYGHGLLPVATHLRDKVDALAVARLSEAESLRASNCTLPILVLEGAFTAEDSEWAIANRIDLVVHTESQIAYLESLSAGRLRVWLKVNTGMNRLGFDADSAPAALARLERAAVVSDVVLMTHFANAESRDDPGILQQLERLAPLAQNFAGDVSVANSPATLAGLPDLRAEWSYSGDTWVRPGVSLFGIAPFAGTTGADLGLTPVMQLESRLIDAKRLPAGASVGYGGRYTAEAETKLGVVAVGYGDGYRRTFRDGTPVWINGRTVPLVGVVSMDLITVDLGPNATDSVGDDVVLWGPSLPVEMLAAWADTIAYELVTGVTHREAPVIVS